VLLGDVLFEVNGETVEDLTAIQDAIAAAKTGDLMTIGLIRAGRSSRFQSFWARGRDKRVSKRRAEARSELRWRRPPRSDVRVSRASSAVNPSYNSREVFGAVPILTSFARSTEVDVIVIDADTIRDLLLSRDSTPPIVLLTEVSDARSISRLLRSGVCAILSRESGLDDVLSGIYAAYDGMVFTEYTRAESLAAVFGDRPLDLDAESSDEITSAKPRCENVS